MLRQLLTLVALWSLTGCSEWTRPEGEIIFVPDAPSSAADDAGAALATSETGNELSPRVKRRFAPLAEPEHKTTQARIDLGHALYFEPLLSRTGRISCNSCHPLQTYGTTNTATSSGVDGRIGTRNAPSTLNAAGQFRQFWDGRAATLEEQAAAPIQNPNEMDMKPADAVRELKRIEGYRPLFEAAFPGQADPIRFENIVAALAAFERQLVTPSPWDEYLRGDSRALSDREKAGARLFSNLGCVLCHTGANVGGTMFQKLGTHQAWPNQSDLGREQITKNRADAMLFKVPSLRNVARTGPYFHDGSGRTLAQAVIMMARHQLDIELDAKEVDLLIAWLNTLTGTLDPQLAATPTLPAAVRP